MECICLKKKKDKKRRELNNYRHYRHTTPPHSQTNSVQGRNPQLPKVNSTGLWLGAPSLYSAGPSPAYYYGRPGGPPPKQALIPRATSEQRISQPIPAHGQRIYHSQQLAPVFEVPSSTGMEIYDVYQFSGGQRSKMLETKHTQHYYANDIRSSRSIQRSKSDAEDKKRQKANGRYKSPGQDRKSKPNSKESSLRSNISNRPGGPLINRVIVDQRQSSLSGSSRGGTRPADSPRHAPRPANNSPRANQLVARSQNDIVNGTHMNRAYSPDTGEIIRTSGQSVNRSRSFATPPSSAPVVSPSSVKPELAGLSSSATDSMKLLAKNKTDDQKTSIPIIVDNDSLTTNEKDTAPNHYIYNEDVYAVSNKTRSLEDENNPIISRMKDMVIEKSRSTNLSPRDNNNSSSHVMTSHDSFNDIESPYAEINSVPNMMTTQVSSAKTLKVRDVIVARTPSPEDMNRLTVSDQMSSALSSDGEGGSEDLSRAGKRITESAFTFLDTYLSDDDATDTHIESPPISPATRAQAVAD